MVAGFISANVRAWAQARGYDTWLLRLSSKLPAGGWSTLRKRWWLWFGMGLSGGLAAALWAITLYPEGAETDAPDSPRAGPIGPTTAVQLEKLFSQAPHPCPILVTNAKNTENFANTVRWIVEHGSKCTVRTTFDPPIPSSPRSDQAKPELAKERGIALHWNRDFRFGEEVEYHLRNFGLRLLPTSRQMPPNSEPNLIWIDIGPGSPWAD